MSSGRSTYISNQEKLDKQIFDYLKNKPESAYLQKPVTADDPESAYCLSTFEHVNVIVDYMLRNTEETAEYKDIMALLIRLGHRTAVLEAALEHASIIAGLVSNQTMETAQEGFVTMAEFAVGATISQHDPTPGRWINK